MDKETRNRIQRATQQARTLLEEDYERQLDGTYDIPKTGRVAELPGAHLKPWQVPIREKLVAAVEHRRAGGLRPAEAVAAYLREAAFTTLNRFVALKMLEARGLVQEALSKGEQSSGFREYTGLAPGLVGLPDHGYRLYLESIFDEIGQEVQVLFDRSEPASLLWPEHHFQDVLDILNHPDLAEVWKEDETIGWVYQYFNSDKDRQEARYDDKGKPKAPQNSRELAVRNQFFTPRYVVEFLTDNTLGRTWYEMRQGETQLVERCQYLVRRRRPVFLKPGEVGPEPFQVPKDRPDPGKTEAAMWTRPNPDLEDPRDIYWYAMTLAGPEWAERVLGRDCAELFNEKEKAWSETGKWDGTFEELRCSLFRLLRQEDRFGAPDPNEWPLDKICSLYQEVCRRWDLETEHIPFRAKMDPRELKILDPACGSGHFLLYCFDLLIPIYEEAWADESSHKSEATGRTLRQDYATCEDLLAAIPSLVLRHNLHGIDIDSRAAQIAALALWMRAQRAFADFALARSARPMIRRTNIVVAEPMPGEPELRAEFLATLDRPLAGLVEKVFEKMELAGEAGSLLRIEEDIRDAIRDARTKWQARPQGAQLSLEGFEPKGEQMRLQELWEVSDEGYWEQAERRVYEALERYAGGGRNGEAFRRRLFAEDAARGFAFVDVCAQRYDVVLMNPPFGEATPRSNQSISARQKYWCKNLASAFLEREIQRVKSRDRRGFCGSVVDRTVLIKSSYELFRREALLSTSTLGPFIDVGWDLLDASVEASALVVSSATTNGSTQTFIDLRSHNNKSLSLKDTLSGLSRASVVGNWCRFWRTKAFQSLPNASISHDIPLPVAHWLASDPSLANSGASALQGHAIKMDWFGRLWWEVAEQEIASGEWAPMYNGGSYSRYHVPSIEVVRWNGDGHFLKVHPSTRWSNSQHQRKLGVGYGKRGDRIDAHFLRPGHVFTVEGLFILPQSSSDAWFFLGLVNSRLASAVLSFYSGQHKHAGYVNQLPIPMGVHAREMISGPAREAWKIKESLQVADETSPLFVATWLAFRAPGATVADELDTWIERLDQFETILSEHDKNINEAVEAMYGVVDGAFDVEGILDRMATLDVPDVLLTICPKYRDDTRRLLIYEALSYCVGVMFGRWIPRANAHDLGWKG